MNTCPQCGVEIPSSSEQHGQCPACLLRLGLDMAADPPFDIGSNLQVLAPIGRGPDATVYLAQHPLHGPQLVTVKLFERRVEAFRFVAAVDELVTRILTCDAAPRVTVLSGGALDAARAFVVARYVPGAPVATYFRRTDRREDALTLLAHVCRLVSDLHRAGIVHGSIKPGNVIVAQDGQPVLLDCGVRGVLESTRLSGSQAGQRSDPRIPDRRSDIAGLRTLAADLFAGSSADDGAPELIRTLARREFDTASELAEEAAALARRAS